MTLGSREVQIWPVWLRGEEGVLAYGRSLLSPQERETADRRRGILRDEYILSHSLQRLLLGAYLSISPSQICYALGPNGKPRLNGISHPLRFNVSHSGGMAIYAFTSDCELGADVERIRAFPDMDVIAAQYFCPEEAAALASLPAEEREQAFFRCWTRKEAFIKAEGGGLSIPLGSFQVTLRPEEPAAIIHIGKDRSAGSLWTLHDIPLTSEYAGSLAYMDGVRPVQVEDFRDAGDLIRHFCHLKGR